MGLWMSCYGAGLGLGVPLWGRGSRYGAGCPAMGLGVGLGVPLWGRAGVPLWGGNLVMGLERGSRYGAEVGSRYGAGCPAMGQGWSGGPAMGQGWGPAMGLWGPGVGQGWGWGSLYGAGIGLLLWG